MMIDFTESSCFIQLHGIRWKLVLRILYCLPIMVLHSDEHISNRCVVIFQVAAKLEMGDIKFTWNIWTLAKIWPNKLK